MDISYFKAIQNASGLSHKKDVDVAEYRKRFARDFDSSIAAAYDTTRNGLPQDFIVIPTKKGCFIESRDGETFNIGDIIYYNTLHWLVTDIDFADELHRSGEMVRCNRQIRWQNTQTGEIVERWCLATAPYTDDLTSGMVLEEPKYRYKIQIPYDSETANVGVKHRFMLDIIDGTPQVYTCTRPDQNTNRYQDIDGGFIVWTMEYDQYNPEKDNAELMIADYIKPGDTPPDTPDPPAGLLPCSISGKSTIRCGMSRTYTAKFFLEDGMTEDSSVVAVWTVTPPVGFEDAVSWQTNGNSIVLTVGENSSIVDSFIRLCVSDDGGTYQSSYLSVEVIGLV